MVQFKNGTIWGDYCSECRTKLKRRDGERYCPNCSNIGSTEKSFTGYFEP